MIQIKEKEDMIIALEQELLLSETRSQSKEHNRDRERSAWNSSMQSEVSDAQSKLLSLEETALASQKSLQQMTIQLNDARSQIKTLEDRLVEQEGERDRFSQKTISGLQAKHAEEQSLVNQTLDSMKKKVADINSEKVIKFYLGMHCF